MTLKGLNMEYNPNDNHFEIHDFMLPPISSLLKYFASNAKVLYKAKYFVASAYKFCDMLVFVLA